MNKLKTIFLRNKGIINGKFFLILIPILLYYFENFVVDQDNICRTGGRSGQYFLVIILLRAIVCHVTLSCGNLVVNQYRSHEQGYSSLY